MNLVADRLTPREVEIAELIACEYSNKMIAYRLGTSEQTIKNQATAILHKLHVHTRVGIALAINGIEIKQNEEVTK